MGEVYRPSNGTGLQTANTFRTACKLGKEYFLDRAIKIIWEAGPNYTTTDGHWTATPGSGHPTIAAVNSSGIIAPVIDAANEGVGVQWKLPPDVDTAQDIDFRIFWCNVTDAAATGSPTWTILYTPLTAGTTAWAVGATALDTTIAAQANVAQYVAQWTDWGTISGGTSAITALEPGDDVLTLKVTVTDLDSTTDANPLLIQARYYRKYYNV